MAAVYYTEPALFDLDRIYQRYSQYNQAQADNFAQGLSDTFDLIAMFPLMGRARDDLLPGLRLHSYRRHVIFYTQVEDGILIERVAQPRQNYEDFFGES